MSAKETAAALWKLIESEIPATRKCLERVPADKFDFKPHPTSMEMKYLLHLVAEIPMWIKMMIEIGEMNFQTYERKEMKTPEALVKEFDENIAGAKAALHAATEEQMARTFVLKDGDKELMSANTGEYIPATINHWIHHRGQLTVYMRISEVPVPSLYGPSGDEKGF